MEMITGRALVIISTLLQCSAPTAILASDALQWTDTKSEAVSEAQRTGRLILLLAGRDTCENCKYMKGTVCESEPIKRLVQDNYVAWWCPVDDSSEWGRYAAGLGGFILPLICVIDPGDANNYLDRTTSVQYPAEFETRLRSHLPSVLPRPSLVKDGANVYLTWPSEEGVNYRIQRSTNYGESWSYMGTLVSGTAEMLTEEIDWGGMKQAWFRLFAFRE